MKRADIRRVVWRSGACLLLAAGAACWLAGCNILGPAFLLVHGPDKTPAEFTLDKKRPTVVFIDDRASVLPRRALRQQIGAAAQSTLLSEKVLTNVIDTSAAMTASAHEVSGQPMDITELGRAVQAEIVIYVTVDSFVLTPDGQTFSPEARFHAKVLDVTKDKPRLWPAEREGFEFGVKMKPSNGATPTGASEQASALSGLANRSGVAIAQLFYSHETQEPINQGQ